MFQRLTVVFGIVALIATSITIVSMVKLDHYVNDKSCPEGTRLVMARNGTFCIATFPMIEKNQP